MEKNYLEEDELYVAKVWEKVEFTKEITTGIIAYSVDD